MKIYTKTGDKGETSLLGGTRVRKSHEKIEAYGTVDELNAAIGVLAASAPSHTAFLRAIQHNLFNVGSLLATERKLNFNLPELKESDILELENEIDRLNDQLPPLNNFILPGGSLQSAYAHMARTICRRAERRVVDLSENHSLIVQYLNRLSDYLFVLSRALLKQEGLEEIIWEK